MLACHSQFLLSKTPIAVLIRAYFVFLYSAVSCRDYIALVRRVGGIVLTGEKQSTQTESTSERHFFPSQITRTLVWVRTPGSCVETPKTSPLSHGAALRAQ